MSRATRTGIFAIASLLGLIAASPARFEEPKSPPSSAGAAPDEIVAFLSVDVGKVWDHPALFPVREARGKLEFAWAVQSLIGVVPTEIDRFTVFWSAVSPDAPFLLITGRKALDPAAMAKTLARPDAKEPKSSGGKIVAAPGAEYAFLLPIDDRTVLLGHKSADPAVIERFAVWAPRALSAAGDKHTLVISLDRKAIAGLKLPVGDRLLAAQSASLTADLGDQSASAKLVAKFGSEEAARGSGPLVRTKLDQLALWARTEEKKAEEIIGARNSYAAPLLDLIATTVKATKVKTEKDSVITTAEVKLDDLVSAVLVALPDAVLAEPGSPIAANNMKQIILAFHNYADTYGACVSNSYDKDGKPLLSWRVHLLPYIEQQPLYNRFKLDEPWDSPHNKPLGEMVVKVFQVPGHPAPKPWLTYLRGFIGPKDCKPEHQPWLLEGRTKGPAFPANFLDGTSNTWLVAEAAEAVPWSKPDDLFYDGLKPLPKLGGPSGKYIVGFADGSTRTFRRGQIDETTMRALITTQGGEVVNIPAR